MNKTNILRNAFIGLALALPLAACSGGGGGGGGSNNPPDVVTSQEDQFGLAFGRAFRAAANAEPRQVSDGDLVPVSFTTEPIDITP